MMSTQTIWLILAGAAALAAVPMMYLGLQGDGQTLALAGLALFTGGMVVTPLLKIAGVK